MQRATISKRVELESVRRRCQLLVARTGMEANTREHEDHVSLAKWGALSTFAPCVTGGTCTVRNGCGRHCACVILSRRPCRCVWVRGVLERGDADVRDMVYRHTDASGMLHTMKFLDDVRIWICDQDTRENHMQGKRKRDNEDGAAPNPKRYRAI